MNENELLFDKLAEVIFPELDESIDDIAEVLMDEHKINVELMVDLVEAWFLKRAKPLEE